MLELVKSGRWNWEEIIQEKEHLGNSIFDIFAISKIFDTLVEMIHKEVSGKAQTCLTLRSGISHLESESCVTLISLG